MQIPFIGGAYQARSSTLNAQKCMNWYPVIDDHEARNVVAMYGTPGLKEWLDFSSQNEVRNMFPFGGKLYAVCGATVYEIDNTPSATSLGSIGTSEGYVWFSDNPTQLMLVDNEKGYVIENSALTKITDVDFIRPSSLAFQDGYGIVTEYDTGRFWISAANDFTSWDGLDYATAEGYPDDVKCVLSSQRHLYLIGEKTMEVWYNSGTGDFPFARYMDTYFENGTNSPATWISFENTVFGLDHNNQVVVLDGGAIRKISTHHIEYAINGYADVTDARAYGYVDEGHSFYVLHFPTGNATWVYDLATNFWHERSSWPYDSRHRSNCYAKFDGKHLVGDYENGKIYEMSLNYYDDDGVDMRSVRRAQAIHSDRKKIFYHELELDMESGVGLRGSGAGSDPQTVLRWSDDNCMTWGNEHWADIGKLGEYKTRLRWKKLGSSRNRVFELMVSDKVKRTLVNAHLRATVGLS